MKVTQLYGIGIITAAVLVATAAPQKYTHSLEQRVENLEQLVVQQQAEIGALTDRMRQVERVNVRQDHAIEKLIQSR